MMPSGLNGPNLVFPFKILVHFIPLHPAIQSDCYRFIHYLNLFMGQTTIQELENASVIHIMYNLL